MQPTPPPSPFPLALTPRAGKQQQRQQPDRYRNTTFSPSSFLPYAASSPSSTLLIPHGRRLMRRQLPTASGFLTAPNDAFCNSSDCVHVRWLRFYADTLFPNIGKIDYASHWWWQLIRKGKQTNLNNDSDSRHYFLAVTTCSAWKINSHIVQANNYALLNCRKAFHVHFVGSV